MRRRRQLQESAVLPQQKLLLLGETVVFPANGIGSQPHPVGFVGRKALDVVDPVSKRARSFMRCEITDQIGTAARDRLTPVLGILLKLRLLGV